MNIKLLRLITILTLSAQVSAGEVDIFDVFTDELNPAYDIKLKTFQYDKENEVNGHRGAISFTNFNVVNTSITTKLNNNDGIYDADIYVLNGRFGLISENFRFAYKLNQPDFEYIDSIKFANILDTHFVMDREKINIDSKAFEFREPRTYIKAMGFELDCDRHPDYLLNDGQGLMAGCFNFGGVLPKGSTGIDFKLKFYDQNEETLVDLNSYVKEIAADQNNMMIEGISVTGKFGSTTKIEMGQFNARCSKMNDVLSVGKETLINPCLQDLNFNTPKVKLTMLEEGDFMEVTNLKFSTENDIATIDIDGFGFSGLDNTFQIGELKLKCQLGDGEITDVDTYMAACLTESNLDTKNGKESTDFKVALGGKSESTGKPLKLEVDGSIKDLRIEGEKLLLDANKMKVNVDDLITFELRDMELDCQKDPSLKKIDVPLILDYCKKAGELKTSDIRFKMINEKNEVMQGQVDSRYLIVENNVLNFNLDSLKMVDKESRKLIKGLLGNCKIKEDGDLFYTPDVIESCAKNMHINMNEVYTEEEGTSQAALSNNGFDIGRYKISEDKAGISDIRAQIVDGDLNASLRARFLAMDLMVTISGKVNWDEKREVLVLDVTHSRLPLGITSRGLFMSIARKFMQSDMITFPSKNRIEIKL